MTFSVKRESARSVPVEWPDLTLPGWSIQVTSLPVGRRCWTCRRYGVTWQVIHTKGDGWRATKFHGGQIRGEVEAPRVNMKTYRRLMEVWRARTRAS